MWPPRVGHYLLQSPFSALLMLSSMDEWLVEHSKGYSRRVKQTRVHKSLHCFFKQSLSARAGRVSPLLPFLGRVYPFSSAVPQKNFIRTLAFMPYLGGTTDRCKFYNCDMHFCLLCCPSFAIGFSWFFFFFSPAFLESALPHTLFSCFVRVSLVL